MLLGFGFEGGPNGAQPVTACRDGVVVEVEEEFELGELELGEVVVRAADEAERSTPGEFVLLVVGERRFPLRAVPDFEVSE